MQTSLKYILSQHSQTDPEIINKIVALKGQHWNYTQKQHLDWIDSNIQGNDYHLRLEDNNNEILAYLNLIEIVVSFDNEGYKPFFGVGNVCVNKKNATSGYGLYLMHTANFLLKQIKREACLLCKPSLHDFYIKSNWIKFDGQCFINNELTSANIYFQLKMIAEVTNINKNF